MNKFTIRVELYGEPSAEVYKRLHAAMQVKGFNRFISENGINYETPHAEYIAEFNSTALMVKNLVATIVPAIWAKFGLLVTQGTVLEIHNLIRA